MKLKGVMSMMVPSSLVEELKAEDLVVFDIVRLGKLSDLSVGCMRITRKGNVY